MSDPRTAGKGSPITGSLAGPATGSSTIHDRTANAATTISPETAMAVPIDSIHSVRVCSSPAVRVS